MKETRFWEQLRSGRFAQMVRETSKGKALCNPVEVYHVMKPLFAENVDVETVYCIFLDGQNHILTIEKMFSGSLTCAIVYPREIVKRVIALAGAVVMAHNHPSGDTTPSNEDRVITRKVIFSLTAIDVLLHDHLIVGNGYHSMSNDDWMKSVTDQCRKFLSHQSQ